MNPRNSLPLLLLAVLLGSCQPRRAPEQGTLIVAAAANLTSVFSEVGTAFKAKTGLDVTFSFGSTAELAQQITHGAPFDVFAAADVEHIDSLVSSGKLIADSKAVYALGQLALWIPKGDTSGIRQLQDLAGQQARYIAVAQPELAPYGRATIEVLRTTGLWEAVQSKIVYANNISQARQLAASGNADATFTAYSLVMRDSGTVLKIDPRLHQPIKQAVGIVAASSHVAEAKQFRSFLLGAEARTILAKAGYLGP